jgi:hypothetical protein
VRLSERAPREPRHKIEIPPGVPVCPGVASTPDSGTGLQLVEISLLADRSIEHAAQFLAVG